MAALGAMRGLSLALLSVLCTLDAANAEEGAAEENNQALGLTMLGFIFLIIGILFLTHYSDTDIRKITWSSINNTLSIFCAVILYKNASQIVNSAFLTSPEYERMSFNGRRRANQAWVALWYLLLCVALFNWCAGVGCGRGLAWRKGVLEKRHRSTVPRLEDIKSRMKCCLFLAHTVGFAGLSGWGMTMNSDAYKNSPTNCAMLIPLNFIAYCFIIKILYWGRRACATYFFEKEENGKMDELLAHAEEQLEDGENDFFGLFMSFLVTTNFRLWIGGNLPDEEGEEGEKVFDHTVAQVCWMYLVAALCFAAAYIVLLVKFHEAEAAKEEHGSKAHPKERKEKKEEEEEEDTLAFKRCIDCILNFCVPKTGWPWEAVRHDSALTVARVVELLVNTLSFSFAWSFLYATQWFLAWYNRGQELVLSVVLAMVVTLFSCALVYVLDKKADRFEEQSVSAERERRKSQGMSRNTENTDPLHETEDTVNRRLMESTGILVGFVWEKVFDEALAGVGDEGDSWWLKPCLALLTMLVICPVWLWYICPMETSSGYILGFLPQKVQWRLERLDLDAEPHVREEVRHQFKEMLEVMFSRSSPMVKEVLVDFLKSEHADGACHEDHHVTGEAVAKVLEKWLKLKEDKLKLRHSASLPPASSSASGYHRLEGDGSL